MNQPQAFKRCKVASIHPHGDKKIVITIAPQPLMDNDPDSYHWYICDRQDEILSDNTHDCGCDSESDAIAIAKNVIDNFMGDDNE